MPPRSHARAGEREREREPLPPAAERVHPHAVAGGWRVWKCHCRGWQHLRAVKIFPLARVPELGEARLDVGLLDRTPLPLVMSALVIEKGRETPCVQLPREELHPRAMAGENTISVGKSPCLR